MNYYENTWDLMPQSCSCNLVHSNNMNMSSKCNGIPLGKNSPLYNVDTAFMLGNLFEGLYSPYKNFTNYPLQPTNAKQNLLYQLLAYQFANHELNLLLDLEPNNQQMIQLFNQYNQTYNQLLHQYEKQYGPLLVNQTNNANSWMWQKGPWPWENKKGGC